MRARPFVFVIGVVVLGCSQPGSKAQPSAQADTEEPTRATSSVPSAEARPIPSADAGLGLSGSGESGGHGGLSGFGQQERRPLGPSVRMGATSVAGRLPPEVIQRIVRQNFGRFRLCYEAGLKVDPKLAGRVTVDFIIRKDGSTADVKAKSDLTDKGSVECIRATFEKLSFPQPEGGIVKVGYPIIFNPPPYAFTINDKTSTVVTADDLKKALTDAGYTEVVISPKAGVANVFTITTKKDAKTFTITFDSKDALGTQNPSTEYDRLTRDAATLREGQLLIAVESDDRTASQSLLDAIAKKTASAP